MADRADLEGAAFGAVIVFLRNLRGWNQDQLREACDWRPGDSRLSRHEAGTQQPRPDNARKIANALGVSRNVLYDLQARIVAYVRENPVEFDMLLRLIGSAPTPDEVRESPPPAADSMAPGTEILERWRALAREKGAAQEREVLLLIDTVLDLVGPPPKKPS